MNKDYSIKRYRAGAEGSQFAPILSAVLMDMLNKCDRDFFLKFFPNLIGLFLLDDNLYVIVQKYLANDCSPLNTAKIK